MFKRGYRARKHFDPTKGIIYEDDEDDRKEAAPITPKWLSKKKKTSPDVSQSSSNAINTTGAASTSKSSSKSDQRATPSEEQSVPFDISIKGHIKLEMPISGPVTKEQLGLSVLQLISKKSESITSEKSTQRGKTIPGDKEKNTTCYICSPELPSGIDHSSLVNITNSTYFSEQNLYGSALVNSRNRGILNDREIHVYDGQVIESYEKCISYGGEDFLLANIPSYGGERLCRSDHVKIYYNSKFTKK